MATLTIDSNEDPKILRAACRFLDDCAMLSENVPTGATVDDTPTPSPNAAVNLNAFEAAIVKAEDDAAVVSTQEAHDAADAAAAQVAATLGPAVDSAGLPWDARIHSSSKALNKNGTWKARKNVDPEVREQVLAELTAPPVILGVDPAHADADTTATIDPAVAFAQEAGRVDRPAPAETIDWPAVLRRLGAAQASGNINQEAITGFLAANEVAGIPLLATRPDLFNAFVEAAGL